MIFPHPHFCPGCFFFGENNCKTGDGTSYGDPTCKRHRKIMIPLSATIVQESVWTYAVKQKSRRRNIRQLVLISVLPWRIFVIFSMGSGAGSSGAEELEAWGHQGRYGVSHWKGLARWGWLGAPDGVQILPSGNLLHSYGKAPFSRGKEFSNSGCVRLLEGMNSLNDGGVTVPYIIQWYPM